MMRACGESGQPPPHIKTNVLSSHVLQQVSLPNMPMHMSGDTKHELIGIESRALRVSASRILLAVASQAYNQLSRDKGQRLFFQ